MSRLKRVAKYLLLVFFLQSTSMAISITISNDGASLSDDYSLDQSTGLINHITLGDKEILQDYSLAGSGSNSITKTAGNLACSARNSISSQGAISSSGVAFVSEGFMDLSQNIEASGKVDASTAGSNNLGSASQESGASGGYLNSVQAVTVCDGNVLASQATGIAGILGYSTGKAQSPGNNVEVTGGLNGIGTVNTRSITLASDNAQAIAAVQADSFASKAYSASKATSTEADAYSYASSADRLISVLSAQANQHVSSSQNLDAQTDSLVYASTASDLSSKSYAEEGSSITGSISASAGSPQIINADLSGESSSIDLALPPVPGTWYNFGGSLTADTPFAMIDSSNDYHVFAQGSDGSLWDNKNSDWYNLGGKIYGSPSAVQASDGKIHIFVRGQDSGLWDSVLNPTTMAKSWTSLGGSIYSSPSASKEPGWPDHIGVAVRGSDGGLWLNSLYTPSVSGYWHSLGGYIAGDPYLLAHGDQLLTFAWGGGADNSYWINSFDSVSWNPYSSAWNTLGGDFWGSPAAINEPGYTSYVGVFGRGSDGHLWANDLYVPTMSSSYKDCGGQIMGKPSLIADGSTTSDYVHAFVRGADNRLWDCQLSASLGGIPTWYLLGGYIYSDPTAISDYGRPDVYVVGGDNHLWLHDKN